MKKKYRGIAKRDLPQLKSPDLRERARRAIQGPGSGRECVNEPF